MISLENGSDIAAFLEYMRSAFWQDASHRILSRSTLYYLFLYKIQKERREASVHDHDIRKTYILIQSVVYEIVFLSL